MNLAWLRKAIWTSLNTLITILDCALVTNDNLASMALDRLDNNVAATFAYYFIRNIILSNTEIIKQRLNFLYCFENYLRLRYKLI
jgi:hypothetical protein